MSYVIIYYNTDVGKQESFIIILLLQTSSNRSLLYFTRKKIHDIPTKTDYK